MPFGKKKKPESDLKRSKRGQNKQDILKLLVKKFGESTVWVPDKAGHINYPKVEVIPTSSLSLNWVLSRGGIPRGRITLIYGPESSGKTTLCHMIIADIQNLGGKVALIDAETSVEPEYLRKCGVDIDNMYLLQPDTAEQAYTMAERLVVSNQVDAIIIDSVAALITQAELEGEVGDQHVALQARVNARFLKRLNTALKGSKTAIILIQQVRDVIGGGGMRFGPQYSIPGGRALKHWSSIILEVVKGPQMKTGKKYKGFMMKARTKKNKVGPPFRSVDIPIMVERGADGEYDYVNLALSSGAIKKNKGIYYIKKKAIATGYRATYAKLTSNQKVKSYIDGKINEMLAKWADLSGDPGGKDDTDKETE